ncbi:MAG TPA: hypothetical protein VKY73_19885, partial [Polyangiaceae bacterium]|nr:hypothetical protein [Polyangiaceae bacterium]
MHGRDFFDQGLAGLACDQAPRDIEGALVVPLDGSFDFRYRGWVERSACIVEVPEQPSLHGAAGLQGRNVLSGYGVLHA